jgi:Terpene cyclase DEP1/Protein of unknown function (DUF3303)
MKMVAGMVSLYMVVEHFKGGDAAPVYERFRARGRLAPDGLAYVASWVDLERGCCFQLMETADPRLLDQWTARWRDLVDFQVHPVVTSAEASARASQAESDVSRAPRGDGATRVLGPRHAYLLLCVLGTVLPCAAFLPFLWAHGLDVQAFVAQLFGTPVSAFFGLDVIVSAVVLWTFVYVEGTRRGMTRLWAPVVASLLVGVSLGLPLFLYMRETQTTRAA